MRRRSTDWYGILRMNISDGNSTTFLRSRWIRCTSTGIATAARPAKNNGARNATAPPVLCPLPFALCPSSDPHEALAVAEIVRQRLVERLVRRELQVVDPRIRAPRRNRVDVIPHHLAVLLGEDLGDDRHFLPALEILEPRRVRVREGDLRRIEDMEHDHFVAERPLR